MLRPIVAALLLCAPALASAQQAESGQPPQRIRSVTLNATDPCPQSTDEEIVVCSRINPNEQFRVPKELRGKDEVPSQNQSWVNKVAAADQIGRVAGGLPNTCSPVGTGGQSGCAIQRAKDYAAEKRQAERNDALVPGGEQ